MPRPTSAEAAAISPTAATTSACFRRQNRMENPAYLPLLLSSWIAPMEIERSFANRQASSTLATMP